MRSADGPFGIFADTSPNPTHTVIGGADPVAVDWVAATKMGIEPDDQPLYAPGGQGLWQAADTSCRRCQHRYRPWLERACRFDTDFTHKGLDANYHFGNL